MNLWLVDGPAHEPIDEAEAERHLRIDGYESDADIDVWIQAAREWAENFTGRAFLPQAWDLKLDAFPCGAITLPKPPVTGVTSITYIDTAGASQTLASDRYTTDLPTGPLAQPGRVVPAYGYSWPSTRAVPNAVTVRFTCGYASADDVPAAIKQAIKVRLGTIYEHREGLIVGTIATPLPQADQHLLWPYKVWA